MVRARHSHEVPSPAVSASSPTVSASSPAVSAPSPAVSASYPTVSAPSPAVSAPCPVAWTGQLESHVRSVHGRRFNRGGTDRHDVHATFLARPVSRCPSALAASPNTAQKPCDGFSTDVSAYLRADLNGYYSGRKFGPGHTRARRIALM